MMSAGRLLSGSKAIGKALGLSPATVKRMHASGRLPTFKLGLHTSPLKIERKMLDAIRGRSD